MANVLERLFVTDPILNCQSGLYLRRYALYKLLLVSVKRSNTV